MGEKAVALSGEYCVIMDEEEEEEDVVMLRQPKVVVLSTQFAAGTTTQVEERGWAVKIRELLHTIFHTYIRHHLLENVATDEFLNLQLVERLFRQSLRGLRSCIAEAQAIKYTASLNPQKSILQHQA
ncbi:hypothetical protein HDV00_001778 [Rhizophlyctis rosea]|nr:hypothetical protein HDV00_001778 [Rhizophlyctis rosea]